MKTVTAELPSPKVTSCSQIDVQPSKPYLNQANNFEAFMKLDWRLLDKNQAGLTVRFLRQFHHRTMQTLLMSTQDTNDRENGSPLQHSTRSKWLKWGIYTTTSATSSAIPWSLGRWIIRLWNCEDRQKYCATEKTIQESITASTITT